METKDYKKVYDAACEYCQNESQENIFGNTFLYLAAMSNPIQIEMVHYGYI